MRRFVFLFTLMQACSFSPTSEFTGLSIEAKCEPVKKYNQALEKHMRACEIPYGVGHYCDMVVSPTRSHLLSLEKLIPHIHFSLKESEQWQEQTLLLLL